jgi:hypothetical protein
MGSILGAVSSVAGMFGGSDGGDAGGSQQSMVSGYYALPKEAQTAYDNYFKIINGLGGTPLSAFPKTTVGAPQNVFDSEELYKLQQANPTTPVRPTGYLEPFNSYQRNALTSMGTPDYSQAAMAQYQNPFQSMVQDNTLNEINRASQMSQSGIMDNNSRLNARAIGSSLGTQLSQNEEARIRAIENATANLGYQGYNEAMGLRNNSIQQQLAAGTSIQQQNQGMLGASNPQGQFGLNPAYIQASMMGPLFGAFPESSQSQGTSWGATPQTPNMTSRLGGLGMAMFGGDNGGGGGGGFLNGIFG